MGVTFNRRDIALEIREVLQLPTGKDITVSPAAKIVGVVINAMVNALLRGERVQIQGFGTFYARTRPSVTLTAGFPDGTTRVPCMGRSRITTKPRKYIHFNPSKGLLDFIQRKDDTQS